MPFSVKDAGVWKEVQEFFVNDGGVWKPVVEGWVKDGGVWKQFWAAVASWVESKLVSSDIQSGDSFSGTLFEKSIDIDSAGTTIIAGAPGEDTNGSSSGAAYVFTKSGGIWSQVAKLSPSDATANQAFGGAVSISGDGSTIAIGARGDNTNTGAVYIFVNSGGTWVQQAKLIGTGSVSGDNVGYSVDLNDDGNTVLIGAIGDAAQGSLAGTAYVFVRSGSVWTQQAELLSGLADAGDYYGSSTALSDDGNVAIIGAYRDDDTGSSAGAFYLWTRSGSVWSQRDKERGAAGEAMGFAVDISGDATTVVSTALGASGSIGDARVYSWNGSILSQQATLTASDGAAPDQFGSGVGINSDGTAIVVGARYDDTDGVSDTGSLYIFNGSGATWTETIKLTASDKAASDRLGRHASMNGSGTVVVGSSEAGVAGAAYVFES